jgi:hypothetical protein
VIDLIDECERLLNGVNMETASVNTTRGPALAFEGTTVLGFIFFYDNAAHLLERWSADAKALIAANQLNLRRAEAKAWNTYTVFLAGAGAEYSELVALNAIEEDLVGTRKIARAGISDAEQLRLAILPLLPIQNAPRLEAVDMPTEVHLRTTELPSRVVKAFLSGVQEASVVQVLEEEP